MNNKIVMKVQLPLAASNPNLLQKALLYTRTRAVQFHIDITEEIKGLMAGRDKAFFEVEMKPGRQIKFVREVSDPGW